MQAERIYDQPDRTAARDAAPGAARQDRPQERVLDRDQLRAAPLRDGPAAPCRRASPPDTHRVARAGDPEPWRPAGEREDAARAQEPGAVNEKLPGIAPGSLQVVEGHEAQLPSVSSVRAVAALPVIAPSVFCH